MVGMGLMFGTVMNTEVRIVGKEDKRPVASADLYVPGLGIVACDVWDAPKYDGPASGAVGFFKVTRVGGKFNGKQAFSGEWLKEAPDLKKELAGAIANGHAQRG